MNDLVKITEAEQRKAANKANKAHRAAIEKDIIEDLLALGLDTDPSPHGILEALKDNSIRHVTINY